MIIHLDSDNPKPLEKKIQDLILRKLFIKVDDEKIFIDKEDFVNLIYIDIWAIAKADYDMDVALKLAIDKQPHYKEMLDTKRNELSEAIDEFSVEIDAYLTYLDMLKEDEDELDIFDNVLSVLNSDEEVLQARLYQIIYTSLDRKIEDEEFEQSGIDKQQYVENFTTYIFVIGGSSSFKVAVEKLYNGNLDFMKANNLSIEQYQVQLEKIVALFQEEINAYKMAMSIQSQNAEIPMILATTRQLLKLEN
jgi:hypothetical protein